MLPPLPVWLLFLTALRQKGLFWQSPWGWSLPPRVHSDTGVCFGVGVDRKGDCAQISVGAIWMKELKTPGSAVFPASLITIPILTPAPKNILKKPCLLHPLALKYASIM